MLKDRNYPYYVCDFIIRNYEDVKSKYKLDRDRLAKLLFYSYLESFRADETLWDYDAYNQNYFWAWIYGPDMPVALSNYGRYSNSLNPIASVFVEDYKKYKNAINNKQQKIIKKVLENTKKISTERLINNLKQVNPNWVTNDSERAIKIDINSLKAVTMIPSKMKLLYANPKADANQSQPE